MKHVAAVIYLSSSIVMGEKNPDTSSGESGPAAMKSKTEIVPCLKDSFAYAHKAMNSLTEKKLTDLAPEPFGENKVARVTIVTVPVSRSFDHYAFTSG